MSFKIDNAKCLASTDKAILVEALDYFDEPQWIPQSQVDDDSEVYEKGTEGTLIISDWFAEKQGWT
jgi:hypothetical protein